MAVRLTLKESNQHTTQDDMACLVVAGLRLADMFQLSRASFSKRGDRIFKYRKPYESPSDAVKRLGWDPRKLKGMAMYLKTDDGELLLNSFKYLPDKDTKILFDPFKLTLCPEWKEPNIGKCTRFPVILRSFNEMIMSFDEEMLYNQRDSLGLKKPYDHKSDDVNYVFDISTEIEGCMYWMNNNNNQDSQRPQTNRTKYSTSSHECIASADWRQPVKACTTTSDEKRGDESPDMSTGVIDEENKVPPPLEERTEVTVPKTWLDIASVYLPPQPDTKE